MNVVQTPSGLTESEAKRWIGHPVCLVSKTGSYYVGTIHKVENGKIYFTGQKGKQRLDPQQQVKVQGLLGGLLGSMLGGGGQNNSGGPLGGGAFNPFSFIPGGMGLGPDANLTRPNGGLAQGGRFQLGLGAMQFLLPMLSRFLI
ncbi:hypothetical protein [Marinicrinis lubricantis]|uniref:Uncharacterized protein n=1 Tax=Marinicrinis lubricantis TaxID=2086470 RepID=A0ABW1IM52_9BACL